MLKHYIKKGCSVEDPPETVTKLYIDHTRNSEYRKSPFIIQAACQGNVAVIETLLKEGCKISDHGFIGLSKKRKNQVISNVVGAAAYNGSAKALQFILKKKQLVQINHITSERSDFNAPKNFNFEYTGYTPLMLAVAGGAQNTDCVKLLLQAKADVSVLDPIGNSALHVAAINQNVTSLEELLKFWPEQALAVDLTMRNKAGETPYSIALSHKNDKVIKLLERYQEKVGDVSKKTTEDLLDMLMKEEEKAAQEKAKRKEKKKKTKLKHIAEKEGVSVEELESRH